MQRTVTFVDVLNQWLMFGFMAIVATQIYLVMQPQLDTIEKTVIQTSQDTRETRSIVSERTQREVQNQVPETIPWENLNPELLKHMKP